MVLSAAFFFFILPIVVATTQKFISSMVTQVPISTQWNVLGPFPIHAREQHYLSPGFPLNLSEPIDYQKRWPSSYADGGLISWTETTMSDLGELRVSFPDVRWKYLRSFGGWAALQHHAVLSTSLKVITAGIKPDRPPRLLVHLQQGSYFTILPKELSPSFLPKWYAGNVYDLPRSLPQVVELPPSPTGEYQIFVSGDYEIRLFGDPVVQEGSDTPVQHIKIGITVDETDVLYVREASQDVVCDFVNGFAFGTVIGVGIRSTSDWVTVTDATLKTPSESIAVNLVKQTRLSPGQTRVIALELHQSSATQETELGITLTLDTSLGKGEQFNVILPVRHVPQWSPGNRNPIKASFLYASSSPTIFAALPPLLPDEGRTNPPILALHGAGVDIVELHLSFWANAMPRNDLSWIIMPPGRTSWGLDWHGPSAQEAFDTVSALSHILQANNAWKSQAFPQNAKVVVIGHSNGGQGVWHISSHFPDRIIAAVPAAAYIKSQAYVPLTESRSSHYTDPILRAILESSLTPDDNDLHLSNIAGIPVLAIHGGADENVPSWHSRELVSVLHTIAPKGNFSLVEEPGKGHWYPSVLNNLAVDRFLDTHLQPRGAEQLDKSDSFHLTVSNPSETGSLHGWKIHSLAIPGRLGSLRVTTLDGGVLQVLPTNVLCFSVQTYSALANVAALVISSTTFSATSFKGFPLIFKRENGTWTVITGGPPPSPVPTRLQTILSSIDTINIIYDTEQARSLASRFAHDLLLYHRLDSALVEDAAGVDPSSFEGNSVIIGTLHSISIQHLLKQALTSFNLRQGGLFLSDKHLPTSNSESYIFLHPGFASSGTYTLVIIYSDESSLERAGKLFPIRTGVVAPAWLSLSPEMDRLGAAGLHGAGVWASDWTFQQASSWLAE